MFVKVILGLSGHRSVYECNRVLTHRKNGINSPDGLLITMEGSDGSISLELDSATDDQIGVYLMNNDGQTIDTLFKNY